MKWYFQVVATVKIPEFNEEKNDGWCVGIIILVTGDDTLVATLLPYNYFSLKIEYHNLYTHFILISQNRIPLIPEIHRARIEKYITGIVNNNDSRLYSIYANPEHAHFLVSRSPKISEETLATIVADSSSRFINENNLAAGVFAWQQSASAFSVSKSDVDKVCRYIINQPVHHKKVSFAEEYDELIRHYQKTLKWEIS